MTTLLFVISGILIALGVLAALSIVSAHLDDMASRPSKYPSAYPAYGVHRRRVPPSTLGPRPPQPPPNPRPMVSLIDFRAPELRPIPVASTVIPPSLLGPVMHTTNPIEREASLADRTTELLIWSREITQDLEPEDNQCR